MDVLEAIRTRRAVREYTAEPVSQEAVRELIRAAQQAPSAMNCQPWAFVVIQDKALLRRYSDRAKDGLRHGAEFERLPPALRAMIDDPAYNVFYDAGTLVVVFARPAGRHPELDCAFAAQNLMLAAHGMGLATCPIGLAWGVFDDLEVRRELGIPAEYRTVLPIIVGHPAGPVPSVTRDEPAILAWR